MKLQKLYRSMIGIGLGALLSSQLPVRTAHSQTVITFDKVVEYVQLDVSEAKIMQLVQGSGTQLVMGAQQLEQLKQAGASDSLINALQAKSAAVQSNSDVTDFVLILDCSGSMNDKLADGTSKWHAARRAAIDFVRAVPEGRKLAMITYGLDAQRQCDSVDLLRPLTPLVDTDKNQLCSTIERLNAVGHTPITRSLQMAGRQLVDSSAMSSIVLITDGMENCRADPVAEASKLVKQHSHLSLKVNVIGFCMGDHEAAQVSKIAQAGNGKFMSASNAKELLISVAKVDGLAKIDVVTDEPLPIPLTELEKMLVDQLADSDISVREAAAQTIKQRKMVRLVPALVNMIAKVPYGGVIWGDSDRVAAMDAILSLDAERVPRAIERALGSNQFQVRVWAASTVVSRKIVSAVPVVEQRLLSLRRDDIQTSALNGTDEVDKLFQALKELAPEKLESTLVKLMRSPDDNIRAWATKKLGQVN